MKKKFLLFLVILTLFFLNQIIPGSFSQTQDSEDVHSYNLVNAEIREQFNYTYNSCTEMNLALSPLLRNIFYMKTESIHNVSSENLPFNYQSHPNLQNYTVSINETLPISGFTYTDQWIEFLYSMNDTFSKEKILELSKEEFETPGCFITNNEWDIFPLLQNMRILPIFISGDLNYYQQLIIDNKDYSPYPETIDQSNIINISNQDILELYFNKENFYEFKFGSETLKLSQNSYLSVVLNLDKKTVSKFGFYIRQVFVLDNVARILYIQLEFVDEYFSDYFYLFGFKSNLTTLFLIALVTVLIRRKQLKKTL